MFRQARDVHGPRSAGFQKQANLHFKLLFVVGIPVLLWLVLMGEDLISGLLGTRWLPARRLVGILALTRALSLSGAAIEPISLSGEIRRLPMFTLVFRILAAAAATAGAQFGLFQVAWSQVPVAGLGASNWLLRRHGGVDWREVAVDGAGAAHGFDGPKAGSLVALETPSALPMVHAADRLPVEAQLRGVSVLGELPRLVSGDVDRARPPAPPAGQDHASAKGRGSAEIEAFLAEQG